MQHTVPSLQQLVSPSTVKRDQQWVRQNIFGIFLYCFLDLSSYMFKVQLFMLYV